MGPGTAVIVAENVELPEAVKSNVPPAVAKAYKRGAAICALMSTEFWRFKLPSAC
jgi:hypothetical protein